MATAQEINLKHSEFQTAVADLESANSTYESAKAPYIVAKQALVDAITRVDAIDDELEELQVDYEPPAPPASA